MKNRIAIIEGVRTPFCRYNTMLKNYGADELGAFAISGLLGKTEIPKEEVQGVILGNVMQPMHATNIARVASIMGGMPKSTPAHTINRNCSSGIDAMIDGALRILQGEGDAYIVGGTESLSNIPLLFPSEMKDFLFGLQRAKSILQKLRILSSFRLRFLKPELPAIKDPLCNLTMGQTAEILAREYGISREQQDQFSLMSQNRAANAQKEGMPAQEIIPVPKHPYCNGLITEDVGPRETSAEKLSRLKPAFQKGGTVTAGNSSQITDGASVLLIMSEKKAKQLGYSPLGYITGYGHGALPPDHMGLGPAFATADLLRKTGLELSDFDLIEINEAFAAQVLAVMKVFSSDQFAKENLRRDKALGEIDPDKLNVNGGAIAIGHPFGGTGGRMVLTLLLALRRAGLKRGLATLCVGGGQGAAVALEAAE